MYHVRYDTTYWGFEGMNYPFGENILFTDNQPMFANAVKLLFRFRILMSWDHLAEIQNLGMIFILLFCALGTFLCFRYLTKMFSYQLFYHRLMLMHPQITGGSGRVSLTYFPPGFFHGSYLVGCNFWEGKHL